MRLPTVLLATAFATLLAPLAWGQAKAIAAETAAMADAEGLQKVKEGSTVTAKPVAAQEAKAEPAAQAK